MYSESPPPIDRKLLIEGLGKGLRVLECFSEDAQRLTATEAGQMAGLTRTAARRYLLSLVHFGYAQTDGKHYWLLPRVLRIGQGYLESSRLPRLTQPFLQRFSMQTGETANLGVLDGHEVVYLLRSNSPRVLSIGFHTGARIAAHCSSAGHAMLGYLDSQQLGEWIEAHDFSRFTPQTVTDHEDFAQTIHKARQLGYSVVNQYANVGLSGIGVPLLDRKGRCVGGLSTTFQNVAYPEESYLKKLLPQLQETADLVRSVI
jgi:IclR family transcriptional regulator, pca regulon regulatory protein